MNPFILIGLGGFFGAIARYAVDGWVTAATGGGAALGTLVVNLSGSLALGVLFAVVAERALMAEAVRAPLLVGFIGAYTTFSTLMLESWLMCETGSGLGAVANLAGSVVAGSVALVIGLAVGRAI